MFTVAAGVLQGCPLSVILFVVAMNDFLEYSENRAIPQTTIRAADDFGGVMLNTSALAHHSTSALAHLGGVMFDTDSAAESQPIPINVY
jgi:hypothetical protein